MDVWWNNHFLCKDLVHHPIEASIYKWLALGFQVVILRIFRGPFSSSFIVGKLRRPRRPKNRIQAGFVGGENLQLRKNSGKSPFLVGSKVVSTHLWNTPRATFTNQVVKGDCLGCAPGVCCNFLGLVVFGAKPASENYWLVKVGGSFQRSNTRGVTWKNANWKH